jgi:hypothetical protein
MSRQRVTVAEAAHRLGVTEAAIRKRIERGTIDHDKDDTGRTYVYIPRDSTSDMSQVVIEVLREQLEAEREANRENRRIIAVLASRIPEIESPREDPREAPGSPESPSEGAGSTEAPPAAGPWWRRLFGR